MSITDLTTPGTTTFRLVPLDLYASIHKAIRTELFAVTVAAGQTDPADRTARAALAAHWADIHALLESHAAHEDDVVQPFVERHVPDVAERIEVDHLDFSARGESLLALATEAVDAPAADARRLVQLLHLDLASFTGTYLAHQDVEERVVMPALDAAVGVEGCAEMHGQILASIPPDEMVRSLAIILPAINVDERAEMLGGMRQSAPPEAFAGTWSLARSVLQPADFAALAARLELA